MKKSSYMNKDSAIPNGARKDVTAANADGKAFQRKGQREVMERNDKDSAILNGARKDVTAANADGKAFQRKGQREVMERNYK